MNLGKTSVSVAVKQEPFEAIDLQPFLDPHRTLCSFEVVTSKHMGVSRSLPDWLSAGTDPSLRDTEVRIYSISSVEIPMLLGRRIRSPLQGLWWSLRLSRGTLRSSQALELRTGAVPPGGMIWMHSMRKRRVRGKMKLKALKRLNQRMRQRST